MATIWYESAIVKIELAAPAVRRIWVERPAGFEFQAGQFVTMDLPIGEKRLQRWRSYSIASAPTDDTLEFCVVKSPDGLGTKFLFEKAEVGSSIKFKGPDGAFFLRDDCKKDLVLVCTGTGVAPFRSMISNLKNRGALGQKKVHLIFGTRHETGILYRHEFEALAAQYPDFQYDIVLSRPQNWDGYKGYVHQVYSEKYPTPTPNLAFYLCGWSNMIDEAVENLLLKLGFDRSQVHYELYG